MVEAVAASKQYGIPDSPRHFFGILSKQAQLVPKKEAVFYQGQRLTYGDLIQRVAAVAVQFLKAGIKPGDKIGILFPNHPDYVASFFAASGIGATIVPINPLLKSDEIAHILSDSHATTLVVHENTLVEALKSQGVNPVLKHIFVSGSASCVSESAKSQCGNSGITIEMLTQEKRDARTVDWCTQIDADNDLSLLVYTSGTTGKPKGAMLTHANMLSVFPQRLDIFEIGGNDKTLAVLPMCHIYGITILMVGTLSAGGTLAILPRFEAQSALKLIESEAITLVPCVPAMYQFMLMELSQNDYKLESVRLCFSGAAPLPADTIQQIESAFGAILIEGFAMTETSCVATINPLKGPRKAGSVGPPLPGVQMKVVDDEGNELPPGPENVGEFWIKGPNIMRGYYCQEEETDKVLKNGWFATGDLGYRDEDNYFYIAGRKKEMIIRGGANIYPREVEDVLLKMEQVVEAAVVGVPDKFMGERVKAVLVVRNGGTVSEEQVKEFCAERLAEYKVPRLVEFRDVLPRNSTGKILKRLLVDQTSF